MAADAPVAALLALADDELVLGHRHVQWTGVAPHLEEDLAFTSIGLDEIGHAALWYGLAAESLGTTPDELALGRAPEDYRSCALVERPNRDWAYTIARQWLYDLAERERLEALAFGPCTAVAEATGALLREERWHREHGEQWMGRIAAGPAEARERLSAALRLALPEAASPFSGDEHGEPLRRWAAQIEPALAAWGYGALLPLLGGAELPRTRRTEDFSELWAELTGLHRAHPGANW